MKLAFSTILLLHLVVLLGCGLNDPKSHAPVIREITLSRDTINTAETATLKCIAEDKDGDFLGYFWTSTAGRTLGSGDSVSYQPPEEPQDVWITCTVGDPDQNRTMDSVKIVVVQGPPRMTLSVDASDNCINLNLDPVLGLDLTANTIQLTSTSNTARFNSTQSYGKAFVACAPPTSYVYGLDQTLVVTNILEDGVYFFLTDVGTLSDNSGSIALTLTPTDGSGQQLIELSAEEHCILLEDSRAAHADIPPGSYSVYAEEHTASYESGQLYTHVYLATGQGAYYRLDLSTFVQITVSDLSGVYVFFTDSNKTGDNSGTVELVFQP